MGKSLNSHTHVGARPRLPGAVGHIHCGLASLGAPGLRSNRTSAHREPLLMAPSIFVHPSSRFRERYRWERV